VAVLSTPSSSVKPVSPRKLLIMGLAVPIGLLFSIALALLLDYLSSVIRGPYDLSDVPDMEYLGSLRLTRR
jgi:capsular polysaccharide biosynthesis protein